MHVVDADTRELVHPLLVCTEARAPTVSRTFEVEVAKGIQARAVMIGQSRGQSRASDAIPLAARAVGLRVGGGERTRDSSVGGRFAAALRCAAGARGACWR